MDKQNIRPWYKCLNGNGLKIIAVVTMLIDHAGASLIEGGVFNAYYAGQISYETALWWQGIDVILRMIGRVSFPIYCFLLAEGFLHTRDVKKYAARLGIFAILSEIPFDMAFWHSWMELEYQNVFFTLFLGLIALVGMERYQFQWWKQAIIVAVCAGLAELCNTDYGAFGVIFISVLYLLRDRTVLQTVTGAVCIAWEITAPLAFIPIRMYNGERGRWRLKYFFYAIYPVHLLILAVIGKMIFRI